jgi:hypothetical protein
MNKFYKDYEVRFLKHDILGYLTKLSLLTIQTSWSFILLIIYCSHYL